MFNKLPLSDYAFDEDGRYTGQEVIDTLHEMLRKHSFETIAQIEADGLL